MAILGKYVGSEINILYSVIIGPSSMPVLQEHFS